MLLRVLTYIPVFVLMVTISTVLVLGAKRSRANTGFVVFSYSVAFWTLFSFLTDISNEQSLKLLFLRIALLLGTVATAVFPFFCAAYINKKLPSYLRMAIYIVSALFIALGFSNAMVEGVSSSLGAQPSKFGILYQLQSVYTALSIVGGLCAMYIGTRRDPRSRNKVRLIVYSLLFAVAINFITGYILVQAGHGEGSGAFGPLSLLIFLAATFYSLIKYRTFDVRPYLARIFLYFIGIGLVICASLLAVMLSGTLFGSKYSHFVEYIAFGVSLATFPFVMSRLKSITQKILFRGSYNSSHEINSILESMLGESEIGEVASHVCSKLESILGASYVQYVASRTRQPKHEQEDGEVFDIVFDGSLKGRLRVGPKKNGSALSTQDRELIAVVVKNMGVVMENVYFTEKILSFNENLKTQVANATKNLTTSNQKLEATSRAKDEFMSMASHQIRPQLTAVRGFVEMLQKSHMDSEQKDMLNWVSTGIERSIRIIADMLNLTSFTSGKLLINAKKTDFIELIHNELRTLVPLARTSGVQVVDVTRIHEATALLDEAKMREVIANFCNNAIQYSEGSDRVEVQLEFKNNGWEFTVRDWGMGVKQPDRKRLFSKYYRSPDAIDSRPSGTGVGLFLAKTVVEAHGGKVFYRKPTDGKGSIFGFWLPIGM